MPEGPLGGPRPFASTQPQLIVYLADKPRKENVEDIERALLSGELPNFLLELRGKLINDTGDVVGNTMAFRVDGEAVSLEMMEDVKSGINSMLVGNNVDGVEVVW